MLNPDPPKTKRLRAKDFHEKLKSDDHSWDLVVDDWLEDIYDRFSKDKKTFRAPSEVKTGQDYKKFKDVLGQRGFGVDYYVTYKTAELFEGTLIIMITLSIPPQKEKQ